MYVIEWLTEGSNVLTLDGRNLVELPNPENYRLYEQYYSGDKRDRRANIRRKANHYRKLYALGKVKMPERPHSYDPEKEPARIEARRRKAAKNLAGAAMETTVISVPTEHLPYHEKLQEALSADGRVEKATFTSGEHTGFIKNADNEIEYTDPMQANRVRFEVKFDHEPKWPIPTRVESVTLPRQERKLETEHNICQIFPDVQIPFGDEQALSITLQVLREVNPSRVVFIGDLLDLSAWGRFEQMPEWANATQAAINQAHQLLASIRQALPEAQIQVLAGNHEERMPKMLLRNAVAAYGLKRADQLDHWPVMSVPFLCAFDQLDVEYIPGYPANKIWLNKNLQIRHGIATGKAGGSAKRTASAEKVSTIFGHDHRLSYFAETIDTHDGGQTIHTYGAGTLSRIDGHVPSFHSGRDLSGQPIRSIENWQNGFCIASYDKENFHVEQVAINTFNNYQTMFRGKVYQP